MGFDHFGVMISWRVMARLLGIDRMYYTSHTLHTYTCVVLVDVWTYVSTHVLLHGVCGVLYRHTMCSIQSLPLLFIVTGCLPLLTSNIHTSSWAVWRDRALLYSCCWCFWCWRVTTTVQLIQYDWDTIISAVIIIPIVIVISPILNCQKLWVD